MRFAKIVFKVAGIWGFLVLTPLYFLFDAIGRNDPPPITHPGFFYGFVGVALAWQVAFIFIASRPSALSASHDSFNPRKGQLGRSSNCPRLARPNAQIRPGLCGRGSICSAFSL